MKRWAILATLIAIGGGAALALFGPVAVLSFALGCGFGWILCRAADYTWRTYLR